MRIKAIVYGHTLEDAERKYKDYCRKKNLPCRLSDAIYISGIERVENSQKKIKGYYSEVMNDQIVLVNMNKAYFNFLYNFYN